MSAARPGDPRGLTWALRGLGLAVLGGALAGTGSTWGFDHLAYLPGWALAPVALLVAFLFLPDRIAGHGGDRWEARLRHFVFGSWAGVVAIAPAFAGLCLALRTRTHFLGDGYLLLDVLGRDDGARPLGSLAWLLLRALADGNAATPAQALVFFRVTSIAAGLVGFILLRLLLPRTGWSPARQLLFLGLHLAGAATLLYCGYVENYSFLYAFLTAFTLAGVAAAAGRLNPAWPAVLLAAAVATHLGALLALPALIVLAVAGAPRAQLLRRLAVALGPVLIVLVILWAALPAGAGASVPASLRADANLAQPLRPLAGSGGVLSARTWVDIANLVVLVVPVPAALLLFAQRRGQERTVSERGGSWFLSAYALTVLAAVVIVDPKLGAARDWDLLAPHAAVVLALAMEFAPTSVAGQRRLLATSLAVSLPWLLLGTQSSASARRLATVAVSFPPYAEGYAFEGLGLYHRQAGRTAEVVGMYRAAVAAQPGNARFHALLGAAYVSLHNALDEGGSAGGRELELAEASYREAHRLHPRYPAVADNLARLCGRRDDFAGAEALLLELGEWQALTADQLTLLFYSQYRQGARERARSTLERLTADHPQAPVPESWHVWLADDVGISGPAAPGSNPGH